MSDLNIAIKNIRNIKEGVFELPLEKGLYAIVGENGCGKSTLMLAMSLIVKPSSRMSLGMCDVEGDSSIDIKIGNTVDRWRIVGGEWITETSRDGGPHFNNHYHGFYEGSIFYGSRFYDYNQVTEFLKRPDYFSLVRAADDFVINTLSYILHGDYAHYKELYKVKTKAIAEENRFKGMPYFLKCGNQYISQYNMSSGESMLISLIDFLNNLTERNRYISSAPLIFLIDEAELALHPAAIDRLVAMFRDLIRRINMVVVFSTHSTEIINRMSPANIYMLENNNGIMTVINPCYPNYAIRNLYIHNGFDYIILVEDELAKTIVERIIRLHSICSSRLWHAVPSGDWAQTLKLQCDIQNSGMLGVGKKVIAVLDGDVQTQGDAKAHELGISLYTYLPIGSVEKYLRKKLVTDDDRHFMKLIGDKYFNNRSLQDIVGDYRRNYPEDSDRNGKKLYKMICANLQQVGISTEKFIQYLCEDICAIENFSQFTDTLKRMLS